MLENNLTDLFVEPNLSEDPWSGEYKIPWNEPGFSQRMLQEHLSQEHDLASRRIELIERQVDWIHRSLLSGTPQRILDLGCGPGLYLERLCGLGHQGQGIDFSPASIEYAREKSLHDARSTYIEGDIRKADFGKRYDLAMVLFGELNVFSPDECRDILCRMYESLESGGQILIEFQSFQAVKEVGQAPGSWYKSASGLFSDEPHICLSESHWDEKRQLATQWFYVIDVATSHVSRFRNTTCAWREEDFVNLLRKIGFSEVMLAGEWPHCSDGLVAVRASRPN